MRDIRELEDSGGGARSVRQMLRDRLGSLRRFAAKNSDIGRFTILGGQFVLVNTPELVHEVLVAKARSFKKSPILRGSLHPIAGQGLFTSDGELWRRQRKLMAPMFTHASLHHFAADMTACAERSATGLADGAVVDVAREMTHLTMAIAGRTLFDADTFSEADELGVALTKALDWALEQQQSFTLVAQARLSVGLDALADRAPDPWAGRLRRMGDRVLRPVLWPGERSRALKAAVGVLNSRVARMIADRRANPGKRDLLSLLLTARDDESGGRMSDEQVRDEVLTLFVAGHETTATALAWALMLLGKHPEVHARVRDEVNALGRVPTFEDLPRLGLCLRVFKESMRLYPPVHLFGRVAMTDVEIGDWRVPKGTVTLVSPFTLHRRSDVWPDPERFDPERFTPEAEAKRHKLAFVPFSAGPRTCIGNHFALMEGPLVLATLLHHAEFTLVDPAGTEPQESATLRPKGGVPMRVRRRHAARAGIRDAQRSPSGTAL